MLPIKDTNFFSEINSLFDTINDVIFSMMADLENVKFDAKIFLPAPQTIFDRNHVIFKLILMRLLQLGTIPNLLSSGLGAVIGCGKDVFYRFLQNENIHWRKLLLKVAKQSIDQIEISQDPYHPDSLPCFIIDDTDTPKRGKTIELIGKVFSHSLHKAILGFKSLNLVYWTGKHVVPLDFSFHIEKGKNARRPQNMTKKEIEKRFWKTRKKNSAGAKRYQEATKSKIETCIQMLRRALRAGFEARYILTDSWFFCEKLLRFTACRPGLDLICMVKKNNWKYEYCGQSWQLGPLLNTLRKTKKNVKYCRQLRFWHITIPVVYKNIPVRVFFIKTKKRGEWKILISSDKGIGAVQAFKIYQNRWSIEVFYKEAKQYCGYGKSQAQDFDAQIANASLSLMAYSILSHIRAINHYQTLGGVFRDFNHAWISPHLMQRFWKKIYQLLNTIATIFDIPIDDLILKIYARNDDPNFNKLLLSLDHLTCET
jgi:hypothetical protein